MPVLLQITSGRGTVECALAVAKMVDVIIRDAKNAGIIAEVIDCEPGTTAGTLLSALIHLEGLNPEDFAAGYCGTVKWVFQSPFRQQHKRKNWFIGIQRVEMSQLITIDDKDIRIETMKGSGPGGQHVNTTESAVRVTHLPTGISAISRDERSQNANKKKAIERLAIVISKRSAQQAADNKKERWGEHNELERGNPVKVYRTTV